MNVDLPLVSIIVITYNSSKYVLETLESAKAQTYQNIELIVSDDGSQDDTVEVCQNWLAKNKDRFVHSEIVTVEKNTGIPANCNRAVKAAQGEWIKLIAGDDILYSTIISKYIHEITQNRDIEILHSDTQLFLKDFKKSNFITEQNNFESRFCQGNITASEQFQILLRVNPIKAPTVFIKRSLFNIYGFFFEKYKIWEDRPMWLNLTKNGILFYYIPEKLVYYRMHSESISRNSGLLFTSFDVMKEGYLRDYYSDLPIFERILKNVEYYRLKTLLNLRINEKNLVHRIINKVTRLLTYKLIQKINKNYN